MSDQPSPIIPQEHDDKRYAKILLNAKNVLARTVSLDGFKSRSPDINIGQDQRSIIAELFTYTFIGLLSGGLSGITSSAVPVDSPGYIPGLVSFVISLAVLTIATNASFAIIVAAALGLINHIAAFYLEAIPVSYFVGLTTGVTCGIGASLCGRHNINLLNPIKSAYKFLSGDRYPDNREDDADHDDITRKVYRRLILRHTILSEIEGLSQQHLVIEELRNNFGTGIPSPATLDSLQQLQEKTALRDTSSENQSPEYPFILQPPAMRSYNLAVTDLFVEKALAYLNRKARLYSRQGFILYTIAFLCMASAIIFSFTNNHSPDKTLNIILSHNNLATHLMISNFIKNFTFYGLIILLAVYTARMGKTLFAQSEQMKDRRHALRQGRLFVHLKGGNVTIEELERAFNWNTTQDNAFFHLNTEAQAPWGNMFKEMMITLRETAKSSMELAKSAKKSD